jgi:hypothetical protein
MLKEMKSTIKLFFITAIISIAMFTACKDDKTSDSSLAIDQTTIDVPALGGVTLINITTDLSWNASVDADWVNLSAVSGNGSGSITVKFEKLEAGPRRTAKVTFTAGSLIKTADIVQRSKFESDYYRTGDVIRLNRSTVGDGIAIVIIGDGFDQEDCKKGGMYEDNCRKLADLFLSMPVIRDFKEYFDIYARVDVSRDRGVWNCVADYEAGQQSKCPQNAYHSGWPQIDFGKAGENAKRTAGKDDCWYIFMGNGMVGGYAMGNMAVYSANEGLKPYWMMHEFAGHIVGCFPDMYYIEGNVLATEGTRKSIDDSHSKGEMLMYDWRKSPDEVYWKDFINQDGYTNVGVYPAAYWDLKYGELTSCEEVQTSVMFGPKAHYTVMERYQLWRKIQRRAGFMITSIAEFKEYDKYNKFDLDSSWDRYDNWTDDRVPF